MRSIALTAVFVLAVLLPAGAADAQFHESPDPYGSGTGTCKPATDYDSCMARCDCLFAENQKRCGSSSACISLALSERNACYGNCMTDYN